MAMLIFCSTTKAKKGKKVTIASLKKSLCNRVFVNLKTLQNILSHKCKYFSLKVVAQKLFCFNKEGV
jgi:hypothetical protein